MAWIAQLQGKIVGLDTAPVIYFIEKHTLYRFYPNGYSSQRGSIILLDK